VRAVHSIMSAERDPAVAAAHVRFAPKATGLLSANGRDVP